MDDEDTGIDVEPPVVPPEGRLRTLWWWSLYVAKDKKTGMLWRGSARQRFEWSQIELFCVALRGGGVTLVCRSRMWIKINTRAKTKTVARNGTPARDVRRIYMYIYIHTYYIYTYIPGILYIPGTYIYIYYAHVLQPCFLLFQYCLLNISPLPPSPAPLNLNVKSIS